MNKAELIPLTKAIEVKGLTKSFNNYMALRDVNLEVNHGESLFILGPNGAGKTTLIKVLATIMKPTWGKIIIDGLYHHKYAEEIRRHIGVVTHETFLYNNLTAQENLEFYSCMYDVPNPKKRIQEVVSLVGMTPRLHERVSMLSRGMQQRLSIARGLLHRPSIMLLDEPETGLDQEALAMLWEVVKGEGTENRTVVITTHNLERGLSLGDRVVILSHGTVAYQQSRKSLDLNSLKQAYEESTRVKK
ncbi:heme ABC exporter ATP-binding protein CcmA [Chloroflexota bacterium]